MVSEWRGFFAGTEILPSKSQAQPGLAEEIAARHMELDRVKARQKGLQKEVQYMDIHARILVWPTLRGYSCMSAFDIALYIVSCQML